MDYNLIVALLTKIETTQVSTLTSIELIRLAKIKYSEKEIVSDISNMLTEMNEILDRISSSGVKMRANDDLYFEAPTSLPQNQTFKVDETTRRSAPRSHDIRYDF